MASEQDTYGETKGKFLACLKWTVLGVNVGVDECFEAFGTKVEQLLTILLFLVLGQPVL